MIYLNNYEMRKIKSMIKSIKEIKAADFNYNLKFTKGRTSAQMDVFRRHIDYKPDFDRVIKTLPNLKFIKEQNEITAIQLEFIDKFVSYITSIEDLINGIDFSDETRNKLIEEYSSPVRKLSKDNFYSMDHSQNIEELLYEKVETDHIESIYEFMAMFETLKEKGYVSSYRFAGGNAENLYDENQIDETLQELRLMINEFDYDEEEAKEINNYNEGILLDIMQGEIAVINIAFNSIEDYKKIYSILNEHEISEYVDIGLEIPYQNKLMKEKNILALTFKTHLHDHGIQPIGSKLYEAIPLTIFKIKKIEEEFKKL